MADKLFLLDGMALIYRGHFALIRNPIFTSRGFNTSALFVFTNTLLEIIEKRGATHLAVAFDTSTPTQRHLDFPSYKAQREEMPEEISASIPHVKRLVNAFNIPVLTLDGYEADDIIGTLARLAEESAPDLEVYMVTPDKDFAQLVTRQTRIFKPGRQGSEVGILGLDEIRELWQVQTPSQVIDVLALWGDASDNVPGVPGVGEKTAKKLIEQFGSVEAVLARTAELKGKLKENLETHQEQALLAKKLVTIDRFVPVDRIQRCPLLDAAARLDLACLAHREPDAEALQTLCVQFEFNSLGKRLFGPEFKAGRGHIAPLAKDEVPLEPASSPKLKTLADLPHDYRRAATAPERAGLVADLLAQSAFCFHAETSSPDPKSAHLLGLAFSWRPGAAAYVPIPPRASEAQAVLEQLRPVFENPAAEKTGHHLKPALSVLRWHGIEVQGPFFDTLLAHTVVEPDQRHTIEYLAEALLGYTPLCAAPGGERKPAEAQLNMLDILDQQPEDLAKSAAETVDLVGQIARLLRPRLATERQERVFFEIEAPLVPVLADLEFQGIAIDIGALSEFSEILRAQMERLATQIEEEAGEPFNQNSPAQLGEILFGKLKLLDRPKKTKTGQFKTDEQTLRGLLGTHPIIEHILAFRQASKLKSTYVDALPQAVNRRTGRVHTQFDQLMTATGRLASNNPNLQNIPIRTEMGREIRKAFIPRSEEYLILSADYSQIELRVMASLSGDASLQEAFERQLDIHTATAARVYGVPLEQVSSDMRSKAKMVNFGIIYGITGFGLAQRLGIPRAEAASIIDEYFRQYPAVKDYMDRSIQSARDKGYAETLTGRRRYLREINSQNGTIRAAAERTAINTPVQGTAADMIKLAMIRVQQDLRKGGFRTRMLLQVHDELVFDLHREEEPEIVPLVIQGMKEALPLRVPIVVETGTGRNWLEAH